MKKALPLIFCFLFVAVHFSSAQEKNTSAASGEAKKILYYALSGPSSASEMENLRKEILSVEGVKEVKAECKAEKSAGQFRILFAEKKRLHEGDKDFDISAIKKLIIKYQFVPGDFRIEDAE